MDEETASFLSQYPELEFREERGGFVRCSLSGHEMPCRLAVLQVYVGGRKFTKLRAEAEINYKTLKPYIVPSTRRRDHLFCTLTNRYINKRPTEVKGHIGGRRYKQALEKYAGGKLTLFKEGVKKKHQDVGPESSGDTTLVESGSKPETIGGQGCVAFWNSDDKMDNEMESGLIKQEESELVGMESESDQGHDIDGDSSSDDQMQVGRQEEQTKGLQARKRKPKEQAPSSQATKKAKRIKKSKATSLKRKQTNKVKGN